MRLSAVIFDLDDTLYPERAFVESGMQAVADWLANHSGMEAAAIRREFAELETTNPGRVFDVWVERHAVDGLTPSNLVSVYRSHNPDIRPFEDAVPVLEELSRQKLGLGLVSDGYLETQRNKFDALGLAHFFQANAVVFSDTWGRDAWKPSSRPYLTALAALNVEGQHAVYVGDNPSKDFKGARGVGMKSIRIRSRGGVYAGGEPESNDFEPDFEVTTIREVLGIIDRIVAA